ncbi:hypothetical protein BDZ45DRAFT_746419 [Acephala macrosclerotiorum]|nr:hypothetical protein BDZ45DRAFT_746419 [Acephala macrosclerotiorum]
MPRQCPPTPTLLTIPTEICVRIFHYALEEAEHFWGFPNTTIINRIEPINPCKQKPSFYGTKYMGALFLISRQLHDEVEEILYTQFMFAFTHYMNIKKLCRFIDPLSL